MPHISQLQIVNFPTKTEKEYMDKLLQTINGLGTNNAVERFISRMVEHADKISQRAGDPAFRIMVRESILSVYISLIDKNKLFYEAFATVLTPLMQRMEKESETSSFVGPWHLRIIARYHAWLQTKMINNELIDLNEESFKQYFHLAPLENMLKAFRLYFANPTDISEQIALDSEGFYSETILILASIRTQLTQKRSPTPWISHWLQSFDRLYADSMIQYVEKNKNTLTSEACLNFSLCLSHATKPDIDVLMKIFRKLKRSDFFLPQSFEAFVKQSTKIISYLNTLQEIISKKNDDKNKGNNQKIPSALLPLNVLKRIQKLLFYYFIMKLQNMSVADPTCRDQKLQTFLSQISSIKPYPSTQEKQIVHTVFGEIAEAIEQPDELVDHTQAILITPRYHSISEKSLLNESWYPVLNDLAQKMKHIGEWITQTAEQVTLDIKDKNSYTYIMLTEQSLFGFLSLDEDKNMIIDYFRALFKAIAASVNATKSSKTLLFKKENLDSVLSTIDIALKLKQRQEFFLDIRGILTNVPWEIDLSYLFTCLKEAQNPSETSEMIYSKLAKHPYSPQDISRFFAQTSPFWFKTQIKMELSCIVKSFEYLSVIISRFTPSPDLHLAQYLETALNILNQRADDKNALSLLKSIFSIASNIIKIEKNMELNTLTDMSQKLFPLMKQCEPCDELNEFITQITYALLQFDKESSPVFISALEQIVSQNILDIPLTKLVVQLIKKQEINKVIDQDLDREYKALSKIDHGLEHLASLVSHDESNYSFRNMLESAIALFSPNHDNALSYDEQFKIFQTFLSQQERLKKMCDTAMTHHIRTPHFNTTQMQTITKPSEMDSALENMFEEFDNNIATKNQKVLSAEEEKYIELSYLWTQIKRHHRPLLEQILNYLNKKLSDNERSIELEIAKASCLLYLDFHLEALEYTKEMIARYESMNRFKKQTRRFIALQAMCLEKLKRYQEAIDVRTRLHTESFAFTKNHYNFLRLIQLYLKIGDVVSLEQAVLLLEAYRQSNNASPALAEELLVNVLNRLKRHDEAQAILKHTRTTSIKLEIQKGEVLFATGQMEEARNLLIDLCKSSTLTTNELFSFFDLFYKLPVVQKNMVEQHIPELFQRIEEKNESPQRLLRQKIYFYLISNHRDIVFTELQRYQETYGEDVFYLVSYSSYLRQNKKSEEAIQLLSSHPLVKENYQILLELAFCYAEKKQVERVKQIFKQLFRSAIHYPFLYEKAYRAFHMMKKDSEFYVFIKTAHEHVQSQHTHLFDEKDGIEHIDGAEKNLLQPQYTDLFEEKDEVQHIEETEENDNVRYEKTMVLTSMHTLDAFPKAPHWISNFFYHKQDDHSKNRKKYGPGYYSTHYHLPASIAVLDLATIESNDYAKLGRTDPDGSATYDEVTDSTFQFVRENKLR